MPPFIPPIGGDRGGGTRGAITIVDHVLKAGRALRFVKGIDYQGGAVGVADFAIREGAGIDGDRVNHAVEIGPILVLAVADAQPVLVAQVGKVLFTGSDQLAIHVEPLPADGATKGVRHLVPMPIAIVDVR